MYIPKCKDCEKPAKWFVWYKDTALIVGGGNIAYNSLCDEHKERDMKEGRDGYAVEHARLIEQTDER